MFRTLQLFYVKYKVMLRVLYILCFLVPNLRCDSSPNELNFRQDDFAYSSAPSSKRPTVYAESILGDSMTNVPIMQWHVGIYVTTTTPYSLVCGGSIVKRDTVISAAHCFWKEGVGLLEAALFRAAAGKVQRDYEAEGDIYTQKSKITYIHIPARFRGLATNYADDLAVLRLRTPFKFDMAVQPVCVGFDPSLENQVLHEDSAGTMLGWGLKEADTTYSLKSVLLPFVEPHHCFSYTENDTIKWLTRDKMCAGFWDADLVTCRGDTGGGLIFNYQLQNIFDTHNMMSAPYIIGVASVAQRVVGDHCRTNTLGIFTQLTFHKKFIEEHIPGAVDACSEVYSYNKPPVEERDKETPNEDTLLTASTTTMTSTPKPTSKKPSASTSRSAGPLPRPAVPGLQWHAAIYFKIGDLYNYVCGGSIVKRDVIISAAVCFYEERLDTVLAPYVATAGKRLKLISAQDKYAQFSVVKTVKFPETYTGSKSNYQDNIAVVHLSAPFRYTAGVQPVCVSFDPALVHPDRWRDSAGQPTPTHQQLTGWALGGDTSPVHLEARPALFLEPALQLHEAVIHLMTKDKICAGLWPLALALCGGDIGAGLTHHSFINNSTLVPYLFAVASTMQGLHDECKVPKYAPAIFTVIRTQEEFLKKNVIGLEEECIDVYVKRKLSGQTKQSDPKKNASSVITPASSSTKAPKEPPKDVQTTLFKEPSQPPSPQAETQPAPAVPAAADNATLATSLRECAGVDNDTERPPAASASNDTQNVTQDADASAPQSPEAETQPAAAPAVPAAADNATLATPLRVSAGVNNDTVKPPEASATNDTQNVTQDADPSRPGNPEELPESAVLAAANATPATPLRVGAGVDQPPEAFASDGTHNLTQNADLSQPPNPQAEKQPAPAVLAAADNATPLSVSAGVANDTVQLPEASASNGIHKVTQDADPSQPPSPEAETQPAPAVRAAEHATPAAPLRERAGVDNDTDQPTEAFASDGTLNLTQNAIFKDPSQPRSPVWVLVNQRRPSSLQQIMRR